MFSRVYSCAIHGVEAKKVEVEVNLSKGIPSFTIVGLPETAVKESRERVETAIRSINLSFPNKKITVNLAPADVRKEGTALDLPIALSILAASGQMSPQYLVGLLIIGELALNGEVRRVKGVLSAALLAKKEKSHAIIVPESNAMEAAMVEGVDVFPVDSLETAFDILNDGLSEPFDLERKSVLIKSKKYDVDFSDVKGQEATKRALEVAAAGSHNILMIGPPGSGKTMLARRLPSILPDMALEESIETTRIHSVAGILPSDEPIIGRRPFRSPHHTISYAGLIGGGTYPKPGEVSLAHNGVLFLDELPEFKRDVLEALRQPLEDGMVTVSRASERATFPARFMLVAAMNPCPCGYFGDPYIECTCTPGQIDRYVGKISGPLMDRIDIHVNVPRVRLEDLKSNKVFEKSTDIKERVDRAREIQIERYEKNKIFFNSQLQPRDIRHYCGIDDDSQSLLDSAMKKFGFSARAYNRILKVSRTIADLDESEKILTIHISEAIQYRSLDRKLWLEV